MLETTCVIYVSLFYTELSFKLCTRQSSTLWCKHSRGKGSENTTKLILEQSTNYDKEFSSTSSTSETPLQVSCFHF